MESQQALSRLESEMPMTTIGRLSFLCCICLYPLHNNPFTTTLLCIYHFTSLCIYHFTSMTIVCCPILGCIYFIYNHRRT
jgi:hypothetical protein